MQAHPPYPLEYHPLANAPRGGGPAYLISRLIGSYLAYAVVMAVLVGVVPKFSRIFTDFNLALPLPSVLLVRASQLCITHYLWAVLLPVPAGWALLTSMAAGSSPSRRRWVRLGAFMLVAAFLIFAILALFMPMISLINGMSGHK
ncbi:MAG TPA: hypothetical protein VFC78_24085 [Tepidisphaeraceae bacterium]|nr:hypothetical protein [Tepidisphaeraceae bacterium]